MGREVKEEVKRLERRTYDVRKMKMRKGRSTKSCCVGEWHSGNRFHLCRHRKTKLIVLIGLYESLRMQSYNIVD